MLKLKNNYSIEFIYFFYYACIGTIGPFITLYYKTALGFTGTQIGILTGLWPLIISFSQPWWGFLADKSRKGPIIIIFTSFISAFLMIPYLIFNTFYIFLIIIIFHSFFHCATGPINDNTALNLFPEQESVFGKKRMWGSLSFGIATVVAGFLSDLFSLKIIFLLYASYMFIVFISGNFLPKNIKPSLQEKIKFADLKYFIKNKHILFFLTGTFIYSIAFCGNLIVFSLYFNDIGGANKILGMAWFLASFFEMPVFFFSDFFLKKLKPFKLIYISIFIMLIRWIFYLNITNPKIVLLIQPIHSLMFAFFTLGTIHYINENTPENLKNTGQAILAAVTFGLGAIVGNFTAGYFYNFGYRVVYYILIFFTLISIIFFTLSKNQKNKIK